MSSVFCPGEPSQAFSVHSVVKNPLIRISNDPVWFDVLLKRSIPPVDDVLMSVSCLFLLPLFLLLHLYLSVSFMGIFNVLLTFSDLPSASPSLPLLLPSLIPYCHPLLSTLLPPPLFFFFPLSDIRLRVRAEYLEHESALRNGISSDKQHPLERQFELFSQANTLLRTRDLGSVVCDIKFTDLDNLEAFWADYLNGDLLEALKLVFISDAVRMAAGTEGVRLLISVDQDDYEEGRRLLWAFGCRRRMSQSGDRNHRQTHWTV